MSFHLVDTDWDEVLQNALVNDRSDVCLLSPFVMYKAVVKLLKGVAIEELPAVEIAGLDQPTVVIRESGVSGEVTV